VESATLATQFLKDLFTSKTFVIFVGFVVFVRTFRVPLGAFLTRMTRVGSKWFDAQAEVQQAGQDEPQPLALAVERQVAGAAVAAGEAPDALAPAVDPRNVAENILGNLNDAHILEAERIVADWLEERGIARDAVQTARVLTRVSASWLTIADFERIWGLIFGSQIDALRRLNAVPMNRQELQDIHTEATAQRGMAHPFDRWLAFLEASTLIQPEGDLFTITNRGRGFLLFLVRMNKPERFW
jgi:hypothetical protein